MAKIYVASSWRNHYSDVVDRLRDGSMEKIIHNRIGCLRCGDIIEASSGMSDGYEFPVRGSFN